MNDQDIIALYFDRNEQAIQETSHKYGAACMQVSMNILNSHPDAEECLNDTYLKTWNTIPPTNPHSLGAFVLRIIRNLSLNRLRDLRRLRRNRELTLSFEELEDCIPSPEETNGELAELLSDFVERQGGTDRILFMGRYWFACPVQDLARRMNMTPNAVRQRLHKTRERLRAYLEERGYRV
jgi:RNA polymerase sigma-70 factor (ECF subfamily)